jgi:hypothetical protein
MERKREKYKGHVIELREAREAATPSGDGGLELLIDDVPVRYLQLPDGSYALYDYAYDWTNDLVELARRFIDYQSEVR